MNHKIAKTPFTAAVGFDGYIDKITRVVKEKANEFHDNVFYNEISDFSLELNSMAGLSGDLEIVTQDVIPGGNGVNIANFLAELGNDVHLIANIEHPVFNALHPKIKCHNYGLPGETVALEFNDGKIMLADTTEMKKAIISAINNNLLCEHIKKLYSTSKLCVFANWACMPEMQKLWNIAVSEVCKRSDHPKIYLDLADFSKRNDSDIKELLGFISLIVKHETYLGLNEKETILLAKKLGFSKNDVMEAARFLYDVVKVDVITHAIGYSCYAGKYGDFITEGKTASSPIFSTGAGDSFSAAWCSAVIWGYDIPDGMSFANNAAYHFVTTGRLYE